MIYNGEYSPVVAEAIVDAFHEFFREKGFAKAVVGLSGGIDSSVTAYLAVRALGAENVIGVSMPNDGMTSQESMDYAEQLAGNLGIRFEVMPITAMYNASIDQLFHAFGRTKEKVTKENLQSRLRAVLLMAVANDFEALLLSTGNQTEDQLGYMTLYGDSCGAIAPIGNLHKPAVYDVGRYLNSEYGECIPEEVFTRTPTAELSVGQVDPFNYEVDGLIVATFVNLEREVVLDSALMKAIAEVYNVSVDYVEQLQNRREINAFKLEQSARPLEFYVAQFAK